MAYSEALAQRIRSEVEKLAGLSEKKMFGGVSFLIHGNLACGVIGEEMIVRVGSERYEEALTHPSTRPFNMTGKTMAGWITVAPAGLQAPKDLREWVRLGVSCATNLPPKSK